MKVPLEPIPTEQIVIVKQKPPKRGLATTDGTQPMGSMAGGFQPPGSEVRDSGQLEKAYPWLLGISTCLSALLCWMYVSKPVIIQEGAASAVEADPVLVQNEPVNEPVTMASTEPDKAALIPSDSELPTASGQAMAANEPKIKPLVSPVAIDPRMLSHTRAAAKEGGSEIGWEKTNLKVQHILSADAGTGENEKIVINVPVLYQTRSMRWTPDKIRQAHDVLARLMLYERSLNNLRKDGETIVADWNKIIEGSVPASVLRADSPSLPMNHSQSGHAAGLPGSSSVIQVEEK